MGYKVRTMVIDLRYKGVMDEETSERFNRIALEATEGFNGFVGRLHKLNDSLDWFVSSPLSRNIFISPLFHYYCSIIFIQELVNKEVKDTVVLTDSKAFREILKQYLKNAKAEIRIFYKVSLKNRIKKLLRPWYYLLGSLINAFLIFVVCRLTRGKRKRILHEPITLVDIFLLPNFNEDRYYCGLVDNLSDDEKRSIFFVPTWVNVGWNNILKVLKKTHNDGKQYLLKEDYLGLNDFVYAWMHFFRVKGLSRKDHSLMFSSIDVFSLIKEELSQVIDFNAGFTALLNYRFAFRLRQRGMNLKLVIDWFENQAVDKGWNRGFREFFRGTKVKGYQGAHVTRHYMCVFPIKEEEEILMIPNEIAVIGKAVMKNTAKYCSDLKVSLAPAFRFQHLWESEEVKKEAYEFTVFAALPMILPDAAMILRNLIDVESLLQNDIKVLIKSHPATDIKRIKIMADRKVPDDFDFVNEKFDHLLRRSDVLISTVSSVCLESIANGVPVIIVGNKFGLTQNPIPESISPDIWKICYTSKEIEEAIRFFKSSRKQKDYKSIGNGIREKYFQPVTERGIRDFLELNN